MGNISTKFEDCAAICPLVMVHFLSEQYNDLVTLTFDLLSSVVVCEVDKLLANCWRSGAFCSRVNDRQNKHNWMQCVLRPPKVMSV